MPVTSDIRGFAGKVPARGDFVQGGLPRDFLDPWDRWLSVVVAGSRELMGDAWLEAYLEAPIWRFVLPRGLCGPRAAVGLFMPSCDRVGRYFPLTFAALAENGVPDDEEWTMWLDAAEALGRAALDEDTPPDRLMPAPPPHASSASGVTDSIWWTAGGPRVDAARLTLTGLPDVARFATMLGFMAPTESAS